MQMQKCKNAKMQKKKADIIATAAFSNNTE